MPSTLQVQSPVMLKLPVDNCEHFATDVHRLDPEGDVTLMLTRLMAYVDGPDMVTEGPVSDMRVKIEIDNIMIEEEVLIHVSSRHMTLASSVFRAMLQQQFAESNTLSLTGRVDIALPDDDPDALLILLNIIHGRVRKVPLRVDLSTLTQLAILVDKYDVHEAVELFSTFWFDNLKSTIPSHFTNDVPAWICICWVFNRPEEFSIVTRLALRQGKQAIPLGELPIPSAVVEAIDLRRQETLSRLMDTLYNHIDDYTHNEHCSFECDALMLGSLIKRLRTLKIFPHRPDPPYEGLCFDELDNRFRQGMYFPAAQRTSIYFYEHSKCAIRSLDSTLKKCNERLAGLNLNDFK
ncbi:hypothetical protein LOZ66_001464 [Ophidiomyces ophidiicola]|nr:hypothetical protein LOZ66_001464 [Ophidiomyces ophidiicola]